MIFLDDYHNVADPDGLDMFVEAVAEKGQSTKVVIISRQRPPVMDSLRMPLGAFINDKLVGFKLDHASEYLEKYNLSVDAGIAADIWKKAGEGEPVAMKIFATMTGSYGVKELLNRLPLYQQRGVRHG